MSRNYEHLHFKGMKLLSMEKRGQEKRFDIAHNEMKSKQNENEQKMKQI